MVKKFPYSRQQILKQDISAVNKVLKSNYLTQGPVVKEFEKKISKKVNVKYAVAVNSATSALHISCLALGLKKNEFIWTVPTTFVASANCGVYCGAKIDFVDINERTFNIDINKLTQKLQSTKKRPKILVTVHLGGQPTEQEKIWKLAKKYNFYVIEDASHSLGASRNKNFVGNCKWSNITVFSFHPVKIITTGEGGMAVTNNKQIYEKLDILKNHGITRNQLNLKRKKLGFWYYEQQFLGFNYRLSDISAALGISQLKRLNKFILERNKIAKRYDLLLQNLPVKPQEIKKGNKSSFHLYIILLELKKIKKSYNQIFTALRNKGIMINLHYLPVHLQPFYKKFGFKSGSFPVSESYAKQAISLPIYPGLTKVEQIKIIKILKKIIS